MTYEAMANLAITLILTLQANALGGVLLIGLLLAVSLLLYVRKK